MMTKCSCYSVVKCLESSTQYESTLANFSFHVSICRGAEESYPENKLQGRELNFNNSLEPPWFFSGEGTCALGNTKEKSININQKSL